MNEENKWSRRQILQWAGAGLLFNTAGTLLYDPIGRLIMPINDKLGAVLLSPELVPEYTAAQIQPHQLIINSYNGTPPIDPQKFRLQIIGQVQKPLSLSLPDLHQMPFTSTTIQQVCVEGWAAVVQWGGVRLGDLLHMAELKTNAKYVYFSSADGYYESWDLASALHPQTMLAYQKNGAPLPPDNGAPLRLSAPIKLGYKLSKWVTEVIVTDRLLPKRGYWEDQGYDWFAGI
jgi:DMSO/TMAO reductase YedYZ molybdopterin-dependent catalytic subunit